jgi:hypothetical protein
VSVLRAARNTHLSLSAVEFVRFLPFLPPSWRQVEMFGDCFTQRNVANAALGDDDDDHHDDVKIPALPALPKDFKMMIEVNMYTHNTSWLASYWQFGNLSRVDYEYGGQVSVRKSGARARVCVYVLMLVATQFWTSIADNNANFRYEFPTSAASNCTQISLNSSFPFAGMGVANYTAGSMVANTWNITGNSTQLPPWQQSWSAVEDDDDDLPEILFFRLGVLRGTIYQLFMGGVTGVTAYKGGGVRNVRGIACNQWTKQITAHPWWPSLACNLTVDAFITAPTTEYFGVNATQVPVRFAIYGTINGTVFNHTYEVFGFTTYRPGAHEASFQFGSCSVQGQIYNALVAVGRAACVCVASASFSRVYRRSCWHRAQPSPHQQWLGTCRVGVGDRRCHRHSARSARVLLSSQPAPSARGAGWQVVGTGRRAEDRRGAT